MVAIFCSSPPSLARYRLYPATFGSSLLSHSKAICVISLIVLKFEIVASSAFSVSFLLACKLAKAQPLINRLKARKHKVFSKFFI